MMEEVAVDRRGRAVSDGSGRGGLEPRETPEINFGFGSGIHPKALGFQKLCDLYGESLAVFARRR